MGQMQPNIPSGTPGGSLPGARPSTNGMHRQSPSTVSDSIMSPVGSQGHHGVMSPGPGRGMPPGRVPTPHGVDGRLTPGRVPTPGGGGGGRAPTPGEHTNSPAMGGAAQSAQSGRIPTPHHPGQAPSPATSGHGAPCPSPGAMSMDEKMKIQKPGGNQRPPSNGPHMGQVSIEREIAKYLINHLIINLFWIVSNFNR